MFGKCTLYPSAEYVGTYAPSNRYSLHLHLSVSAPDAPDRPVLPRRFSAPSAEHYRARRRWFGRVFRERRALFCIQTGGTGAANTRVNHL